MPTSLKNLQYLKYAAALRANSSLIAVTAFMDNYFVEIAATRRGLFGVKASVQTRPRPNPLENVVASCKTKKNKRLIQKRE
jgi:hypothetical protein